MWEMHRRQDQGLGKEERRLSQQHSQKLWGLPGGGDGEDGESEGDLRHTLDLERSQ